MDQYAGIDVSLECSSVCVVDGEGKIFARGEGGERAGGADRLVRRAGARCRADRAGGGPLSQWLYAAMQAGGLAVELLETRHVRDAFKAMPVKTDRKDARGIAQLMRLGWFRPVHCKSSPAQEVRALLTARKLLQSKLSRRRDEPAGRAARLRPEGRHDDPNAPSPGGSSELVERPSDLELIAMRCLKARASLLQEFTAFEKQAAGSGARRMPGPAA